MATNKKPSSLPPEPDAAPTPDFRATINNATTTVRIPPEHLEWAIAMGASQGRSISGYIRGVIDDLSSWYQSSSSVVSLIEADRRAMGMTRREYTQHLILRRFEEIRAKGVGYEAESFLLGPAKTVQPKSK
jgi:hypothetical protein